MKRRWKNIQFNETRWADRIIILCEWKNFKRTSEFPFVKYTKQVNPSVDERNERNEGEKKTPHKMCVYTNRQKCCCKCMYEPQLELKQKNIHETLYILYLPNTQTRERESVKRGREREGKRVSEKTRRELKPVKSYCMRPIYSIATDILVTKSTYAR